MYKNIKTIKVGTFNLMNFMLPNTRLYGGTLQCSQDDYDRKCDWVEFMLEQMDADIVGFQELFHREAMNDVLAEMPGYQKAHLYVADESGDQPCVALLSRYPVENVEVFTHFPQSAIIDFNPKGRDKVILPFTTFTRPVLKADIRIKEYGVITVFVVHLKSKRGIFYEGEDEQNPIDIARAESRSLMLRASESVALRALVADTLKIPDRPVIVCGDVNDVGNAVTTRIISGEVPQHRLPDDVKKSVWDVLLYHVKDIQARRSYQDFYYTHIHNGMYESLDHIMVSQELVTEYPRNTGRVGLVSVYNDHLVDQTFSKKPQDRCKSDHGIVVCSIELDIDRARQYMKNNTSRPRSSSDDSGNRSERSFNRNAARESAVARDADKKPVIRDISLDSLDLDEVVDSLNAQSLDNGYTSKSRARQTKRQPIADVSAAAAADVDAAETNSIEAGAIETDDSLDEAAAGAQFNVNDSLDKWQRNHSTSRAPRKNMRPRPGTSDNRERAKSFDNRDRSKPLENRDRPKPRDNRERPQAADNRERPQTADNRERPQTADNRERPQTADNREPQASLSRSHHKSRAPLVSSSQQDSVWPDDIE